MLAHGNPSPHYQRPLLTTPFFERSRFLVETDAYSPWSGYTIPDVYSSIEQEYFACFFRDWRAEPGFLHVHGRYAFRVCDLREHRAKRHIDRLNSFRSRPEAMDLIQIRR